MIVFIDVDGVVADLHTPWIERINSGLGYEIELEDIKEWDMSKLVAPGHKEQMFKIIENPNIYDVVEPIPNALEGVLALRNAGYRVVFATTPAPGTYGRKLQWLIDHGFLENIWSKDYVETRDKSILANSQQSWLIDDSAASVANFPGIGVLFDQPWNRTGAIYRIMNWGNVIKADGARVGINTIILASSLRAP